MGLCSIYQMERGNHHLVTQVSNIDRQRLNIVETKKDLISKQKKIIKKLKRPFEEQKFKPNCPLDLKKLPSIIRDGRRYNSYSKANTEEMV